MTAPPDSMPPHRPSALLEPQDKPAPEPAHIPVLHEGVRVAIRIAIIWLMFTGLLLVCGLAVARPILYASEQLMRGNEFSRAGAPLALFAVFGIAVGMLLAWRIVESAGLVGSEACVVGLAATAALCLVAAIAALLLYQNGPPMVLWLGLILLAICSAAAIWYRAAFID